MESQRIKVLLIEDNAEDALILREALAQEEGSPFEIEHATRLSVALKHLAEGGVELVLCDLELPDSKGPETVAQVRRQAPQVPIVVLTASDNDGLALQSLQRGAQDYLVKGYVQVYPTLLRRAMRYALERKRAQDEIRSAHGKTEQLLSSIPSILIEVNPDGLVSHWNPIAEAVFNIPAAHVLNRPFGECGIQWNVGEILEGVDRCRTNDQLTRLDEVRFKRPDGQDGYLGVTIIPMKGDGEGGSGVLLFGADVTERKQTEAERQRLQEQLTQAQQMETIGRFAGGIAHDFNNFLQIILGFTGLIRARHPHDQALMNDLDEVIHASESASGMVQQLLAFSRRRPSQPKVFEVNQRLANMVRLIQQLVGERIRVNLQLAGGALIVKLDPTGLEQVIMNLCSNARDSMCEGGTLTIGTSRVVLDAAFVETHSWAQAGDYVRVSVRDTGTGMEPEVIAKIFEPFFTTKPRGRGTGLGLAVVYGLVTQHEGFIDLESAPGKGTAFHLYFPRQGLSPEEEAALAKPSQPAAVTPPLGGGKVKRRVLIVDDDPSIGTLCSRILKDSYETATTASPQDALEMLKGESYDVLLSDILMPKMDGLILSREAMKLKPGLKIVLMTGSFATDIQQRLQSSSLPCEMIQKPFTAATLRQALQRCF